MSELAPAPPHPLAVRLIDHCAAKDISGTILEVGSGRGRNTRALREAGLDVTALSDDQPYTQLPGNRNAYAAALSSHAYLHGSSDKVRIGMADLRRVLKTGGYVFLTLGSISDARFGLGIPHDEHTYAPGDGPEKGIPHAYFERGAIPELLRGFAIEELEEVDVDQIVGRWAHDPAETGMRHWFVVARKL